MRSVAAVSFWLSISWIAWALIVYPLLAFSFGSLANSRRGIRKAPVTPPLTVIISAYNEETVIHEKIRQTLALDYPADRLEVLVVSDGSTDRTDEIVASYGDPRVMLHRAEGRQGKTAAANEGVLRARGEILVFSDATGVYSKNALRALASNFADPTVGCVAGRVAYRFGNDATSKGFSGYQRIAVAIRRAENAFGDQTSVSGSIHAIRRELFRPGRPEFSADVIDAVHTVVQGRRVVYENEAVSLEDSRTRNQDEFRARIRISVQNASMAPYVLRELVAARRWFYLFQMVSHKMMRWWMWAPLLTAALTSCALASADALYFSAAVTQMAFYSIAAVGLTRPATSGMAGRLLAVTSFFLLGNAAMCVGTLRGLRGEQAPAWEPVR